MIKNEINENIKGIKNSLNCLIFEKLDYFYEINFCCWIKKMYKYEK